MSDTRTVSLSETVLDCRLNCHWETTSQEGQAGRGGEGSWVACVTSVSTVNKVWHLCKARDGCFACKILQYSRYFRSSPHHVAQHHPTGSETTPPYAPRSSRFGSEPPSVEDDVDVWCYEILELHARNDDDEVFLWGFPAGQRTPTGIECNYLMFKQRRLFAECDWYCSSTSS